MAAFSQMVSGNKDVIQYHATFLPELVNNLTASVYTDDAGTTASQSGKVAMLGMAVRISSGDAKTRVSSLTNTVWDGRDSRQPVRRWHIPMSLATPTEIAEEQKACQLRSSNWYPSSDYFRLHITNKDGVETLTVRKQRCRKRWYSCANKSSTWRQTKKVQSLIRTWIP